MNGDIVTRVDFRDISGIHRRHGADVTMGVRRYELDVPYGVVECEGPLFGDPGEALSGFPGQRRNLSARAVGTLLPSGERFA